jgi:hypothetical protein
VSLTRESPATRLGRSGDPTGLNLGRRICGAGAGGTDQRFHPTAKRALNVVGIVRAAPTEAKRHWRFGSPWDRFVKTPEHSQRSDRAGLTFELSGRHRQGAWAARRMICMTASRPKRLAGGGPLERRVRPHFRYLSRTGP